MDAFALTTTTATTFKPSLSRFNSPRVPCRRRFRNLSFHRKPMKHVVYASADDPNLDKWDRMELKFGKLIGEDPELTLAKIMSRKLNPDMSSLKIEKLFEKGKSINDDVEEFEFDGSGKGKLSNGLQLVKPVPKKGVKFDVKDKPTLPDVKKPNQPFGKAVNATKSNVTNVILRKPTVFREDDIRPEESSRLGLRPNLSLRLGNEQQKERFSDITLLKKPEPVLNKPSLDEKKETSGSVECNGSKGASAADNIPFLKKPQLMNLSLNADQEQESSVDATGSSSGTDESEGSFEAEELYNDFDVTKTTCNQNSLETREAFPSGDPGLENDFVTGLQLLEQSDVASSEESSATRANSIFDNTRISVKVPLQGKPKRRDDFVEGTSNSGGEEKIPLDSKTYGNSVELEKFLATSPIKEQKGMDWTTAEKLVKTGGRLYVELLSASTRGFAVSCGSLLGFLPYRYLSSRWKFIAFESWLRKKGLDPSKYKQDLTITRSYGANSTAKSTDLSLDTQNNRRVDRLPPDPKLDDVLRIYDQEKRRFISSFVGQKIRLTVVLADRKSGKLIFSMKPKESEEMVEKKKILMARLNIGDVVKCTITKITYFGIFVEVEGVVAMIKQKEVSWDATLDPATCFKIGQVLEAKVYILDFTLQRIFLSLKETQPDPLMQSLGAILSDHGSIDGRLEATLPDTQWPDVESLINELERYEGVKSVRRGSFFLSPGLAPTFQVYMASVLENQYKLLARAGNKVQEVIVETSLKKDQLKAAIMTCTNRVG